MQKAKCVLFGAKSLATLFNDTTQKSETKHKNIKMIADQTMRKNIPGHIYEINYLCKNHLYS